MKKGIKGKIAKNATEIQKKATLTHLSALCACFFFVFFFEKCAFFAQF
jgi:hypothetical protein